MSGEAKVFAHKPIQVGQQIIEFNNQLKTRPPEGIEEQALSYLNFIRGYYKPNYHNNPIQEASGSLLHFAESTPRIEDIIQIPAVKESPGNESLVEVLRNIRGNRAFVIAKFITDPKYADQFAGVLRNEKFARGLLSTAIHSDIVFTFYPELKNRQKDKKIGAYTDYNKKLSEEISIPEPGATT